MKLELIDGLPFTTMDVVYQGKRLRLDNILVDTGSSNTIISADNLLSIGVFLEPDDTIHRIRGVGGSEFVFTKQLNRVILGNSKVEDFEVEVGAMAYGFEIVGIIGMDLLREIGAIIDLAQMEIYTSSSQSGR